jgi:hypothetical protein
MAELYFGLSGVDMVASRLKAMRFIASPCDSHSARLCRLKEAKVCPGNGFSQGKLRVAVGVCKVDKDM